MINYMDSKKSVWLTLFYSLTLVLLVLFSYTQVDLNLTISSNPIYQRAQQFLTYIGYFRRPSASFLYLTILAGLYITYSIILKMASRKNFSLGFLWQVIGLSMIFLFFAYPAFSHDFFNYMFDARIVTKYHLNPYYYKALDFDSDLWVRFMHWTHRTYPYGPVWLILTIPFSFLGWGKFVITLFNFKLMFLLFHFGNIVLIYKILSIIDKKNAHLGMAFFALNPLIMIESLVNGHNEVAMLFFLLAAIYFLMTAKNLVAVIISILLSAGIKFVTIVTIPTIAFGKYIKEKKYDTVLWAIMILLLPVLLLEIVFREAYPWYFIPIVGISALLIKYKNFAFFIQGLSLASLLRYLPFFYYGEYSPNMERTREMIFFGTLIFFAIIILAKIWRQSYLLNKHNKQ